MGSPAQDEGEGPEGRQALAWAVTPPGTPFTWESLAPSLGRLPGQCSRARPCVGAHRAGPPAWASKVTGLPHAGLLLHPAGPPQHFSPHFVALSTQGALSNLGLFPGDSPLHVPPSSDPQASHGPTLPGSQPAVASKCPGTDTAYKSSGDSHSPELTKTWGPTPGAGLRETVEAPRASAVARHACQPHAPSFLVRFSEAAHVQAGPLD